MRDATPRLAERKLFGDGNANSKTGSNLPAGTAAGRQLAEDVQYHLYVIEKMRRGVARAETEGTISQAQAEDHLGKWLIKS